jgi:hypothetical protein
VVRDEDLRTQSDAEFPRVMQFIDGRPSDRLRPADPANPDSLRVRRGRVGGYRDYFTLGE